MKLTIQIDDEIAETYERRLRANQTLEQVLAIQLKRYQHVDPRDRIILIDPPVARELEKVTNHLPLRSADDLVKRVSEMAELSIGQIRFRFTPAQWRELKHRAERWRMPLAVYAARIVRQIEMQFFNEVPREIPLMAGAPQGAPPGEKPKQATSGGKPDASPA